ncbi:MAG: PhaM family polyhydroxyalkanoate granule multifunctional regulatory protein [Rhodoferax sp.]
MSDSKDSGFGKFVPGFDFLQSLAKGASGALPQMPNLANWVSPSLNLEELEKRIDELKAVHFWLDQNSKALGATIQALEVQKMTLATLKGMNFNLGDVANAFKLKAADSMASSVKSVTERAASAAKAVSDVASSVGDSGRSKAATKATAKKAVKPGKASAAAAPTGMAGLVDPMQLWGSLTQQFQQIAATAMKDVAKNTAVDVNKNMATGLAKEAIKATKKVAASATGTRAKGRKA